MLILQQNLGCVTIARPCDSLVSVGLADFQNDLADMIALFHPRVSCRDILKGKDFIHDWCHRSIFEQGPGVRPDFISEERLEFIRPRAKR